jgi:hypothetical protein
MTRLPVPHSDAVADVEAAIVLLERGKTGMALSILRQVPARFRADLIEGIGQAAMQMHLNRVAAATQRRTTRQGRLEWLRGKVADPAVCERAKGLLGLGEALLERVLAGACDLGPGQWRRLRRGLEEKLPRRSP